jgi:hypothetical protein
VSASNGQILHFPKIIVPTNQKRLLSMNNPSSGSISQSECSANVATATIIDRLKQATTDLLWSSESDYPFELVTWDRNTDLTPAALLSDLTADDRVESISLSDLFSPVITVEEWYENEELAIVDRYQVLLQTIESNLSDIQVFRVGEIEIAIYIVGKTSTGDLIGLKTLAIET